MQFNELVQLVTTNVAQHVWTNPETGMIIPPELPLHKLKEVGNAVLPSWVLERLASINWSTNGRDDGLLPNTVFEDLVQLEKSVSTEHNSVQICGACGGFEESGKKWIVHGWFHRKDKPEGTAFSASVTAMHDMHQDGTDYTLQIRYSLGGTGRVDDIAWECEGFSAALHRAGEIGKITSSDTKYFYISANIGRSFEVIAIKDSVHAVMSEKETQVSIKVLPIYGINEGVNKELIYYPALSNAAIVSGKEAHVRFETSDITGTDIVLERQTFVLSNGYPNPVRVACMFSGSLFLRTAFTSILFDKKRKLVGFSWDEVVDLEEALNASDEKFREWLGVKKDISFALIRADLQHAQWT